MMLPAMLIGFATVTQGSLTQGAPATAELVAAVSAAKANEPFLAAIIVRTQPGWHVSWQNPGDAGTPIKVEWKLPEGWQASSLKWPVPQRFYDGSKVTYGYEGSTLLLSTITPGPKPNAGPASIAAKVTWVATNKTDVAGSKDLRLGLTMMPVKSGPHRTWFDRLTAIEKAMPSQPADWAISAAPIEGGFVLKVKPPEVPDLSRGLPTFYPSDPGVVDHAFPQNFRKNEDGSLWLALKKSAALTAQPERLRGILLAPRGTKWHGGLEAILIDVPIANPYKENGRLDMRLL